MDTEVVRYTAPSGARVFSWGSIYFVWGLDNYYGHRDGRPIPTSGSSCETRLPI